MDTPETASPGPNVIFQDDADSLATAAAELADQGVDKVIALTHVGYLRDLELAAEVPGIDAVIGGHSHTLLGDMEGATAAYPPWSTGQTARRCRWRRSMPMASILAISR